MPIVDQVCAWNLTIFCYSYSFILASGMLLTKKDSVDEYVFFLWVCSPFQICPSPPLIPLLPLCFSLLPSLFLSSFLKTKSAGSSLRGDPNHSFISSENFIFSVLSVPFQVFYHHSQMC